MRDSLFNSFIPLTSLTGRVVFGGGFDNFGGSRADPTPTPAPAPPPPPPPPPKKITYTSDYPELSGQVYNTIEDRDAAEARIDAAKGTTYTSDVDFSNLPPISDSQTKLAELKASPVDDPGEFKGTTGTPEHEEYLAKKAKYDSYKSQVEEAAKNLQYAQTAQGIQSQEAAREMAQTGLTDPAALVSKATTAKIDPNAEGTTIATGTGQLTGTTPQATTSTVDATQLAGTPDTVTAATYTAASAADKTKEALEGERDYKRVSPEAAGFIPPSPFQLVTQATQTFHNPTTGEVVTVPTGGYTAPEGFVKGSPQGKFKTKGITAATGEVSDEAQVTAAQGELSPEAMAQAAGFDEKYMKEVQAGERKVTEDELVQYAQANNIPKSEAAKMLEPYLDVAAAKFVDETPQAEAKDVYNLKPTEIAQQTATKVQDAVKAAEIPTAEAAQSQFQSTVQAAQGRVGSNELVNAKDIVATEKSVTAIAATMKAVNEDAIAVAATGSFSQAALAKAAQGTVSPQATVQGQMAELMEQFNDGTPAWAAGAMRAANAAMAARGLGASSMAGAAVVQAAMESAIPIAQQDAQAFQAMDMANLNNRQQVALSNAAAQQNIELTNLNNQQQAALQNSANAFALQSQNLSNEQAVVLANAQMKAALQGQVIDVKTQTSLANAAKFAEVNKLNLNNQQQANLTRSAQNLEIEVANLSNAQQTALSNLQVRAALRGQELSNEQQMAMLESTQDFERAAFDASAKQQAFLQDAQAQAALEGKAMDIRQQTQLFNVSAVLEERQIELTNEQQTRIFNASSKLQIDMAELSNRQQTALANAQIEAALRGQELSNKQQSAILNAEKFAEANNLTFTAEQQAQLANSQMMQTIGLAEMSNKQAATLQNAAQIASMDMANLSNAQQAAVQNAQAFLQMDMANLTNEQQTAMFKAQAIQQSILSDQAANNAALQFNASSENQTNQFMAQMKSQVDQFNAAQKNATAQFNAGQENATSQFNTQIQNQRDQFNANNALVVAQANAQWRQNAETINTAAQNEANLQAATAANAFTQSTLDQIWQRERDLMDYSFKASETSKDRALELVLADKQYDAYADAQASSEAAAEERAKWQVWTNLLLS